VGSQREARRLLESGTGQLGIRLSGEQEEKLLGLIALLARWSRAYNLTAVRDPVSMVPVHLLDSLAIHPHLRGERVLDVGTGAGFPGLPLAIVQPERRFLLTDSNGKKIRFVRQALLELEICNAQAVQTRIQSYKSEEKFATILARAFAPLPDILRLTRPLLARPGVLLALKGPNVDRELQDLPGSPASFTLHRLRVPYLESERSVVEIHVN
jgi:16S rRNA (guanine527-N7)-methyltransferase